MNLQSFQQIIYSYHSTNNVICEFEVKNSMLDVPLVILQSNNGVSMKKRVSLFSNWFKIRLFSANGTKQQE